MLNTLLSLLVGLLILGLIWWVIRYIVGAFGLPHVIAQVAGVVIAIIAVAWLISILVGASGGLDLPALR